MNTLIPGAPLRSLSPTSIEYQRAQGASRAAKPVRAARFTLDAPEHSGTIPGAMGDILPPGKRAGLRERYVSFVRVFSRHVRSPISGTSTKRLSTGEMAFSTGRTPSSSLDALSMSSPTRKRCLSLP